MLSIGSQRFRPYTLQHKGAARAVWALKYQIFRLEPNVVSHFAINAVQKMRVELQVNLAHRVLFLR